MYIIGFTKYVQVAFQTVTFVNGNFEISNMNGASSFTFYYYSITTTPRLPQLLEILYGINKLTDANA